MQYSLIQRIFVLETCMKSVVQKFGYSLLAFGSFEIKNVWGLKEVISDIYSTMQYIILYGHYMWKCRAIKLAVSLASVFNLTPCSTRSMSRCSGLRLNEHSLQQKLMAQLLRFSSCNENNYVPRKRSPCHHVSAKLLLNGFPWNLILRILMKICRGNPYSVKIGQSIGHFTWKPKYVSLVSDIKSP